MLSALRSAEQKTGFASQGLRRCYMGRDLIQAMDTQSLASGLRNGSSQKSGFYRTQGNQVSTFS